MTRRVEKFQPAEMTPEQRAIYDAITGGPRALRPQLFPQTDAQGALEGPFNAWLINPVLGSAMEVMGSAYADGMQALPARRREIAILVVAQRMKCAFELYAHIRVSRANGMSEEEIWDLVEGRPHTFEDPVEQVIYETVPLLMENSDLDDTQYQRLLDAVGVQGVYALLWLTSWYSMLALQLNVLRVPLPDGQEVGD